MHDKDTRDRLLASIAHRLRHFTVRGDPLPVIEPQAIDECAALLAAVNHSKDDLEVFAAVGSLHWSRYIALRRSGDREAASALFYPVYLVRPEVVPQELVQTFQSGRQVNAVPADDPTALPSRTVMLVRRSGALENEFVRTGNVRSLDESIRLLREAVAAIPDDHPELGVVLSLLAAELKIRFDQTGNLDNLREAVHLGRRAVELIPNDGSRAAIVCLLGEALCAWSEHTGELAALEEAIRLHKQAVKLTPNSAEAVSDLSGALETWAARTGDLPALKEALRLGRRAVELAPRNAGKMTNLGHKLHAWFQRTGDYKALEEAVHLCRRAVELTHDGDFYQDVKLFNLATTLRDQAAHSGQMAEFNEAIGLFRNALTITPDGHPRQANRRSGLADALQLRFDRIGDPADLQEAIRLLRQAVAATPDGHPDEPACLSQLGSVLISASEYTGEPTDPNEVVDLFEAALSATPPDDHQWARQLSSFGDALRFRYQRTGDPADLDKAVDLCGQAIDRIPDEHPDLDVCLFNMASALRARFDRIGDLGALEKAINAFRRATDLIPDGPSHKPVAFALLGAALRARFDRTGDLTALNEAIDAGRRAVDLIPERHPSNAVMLNNLGNTLQAWHERTGDPDAVREAALMSRRAVESIPDDHPNRAMYLTNFGNTLREWSANTEDPTVLQEAIDTGRRAVELVFDGHFYQAGALFNFGVILRTQFERTGDTQALQESVNAFRTAANVESAPTLVRVKAGAEWGRLAEMAENWEAAHEGLSYAVGLLPTVAPRELDRPDQEYGLGQLAGLASHAAASALRLGQPEQALELLEQGRGVLISQALETGTSISELRSCAPELAEQFELLRNQLNQAVPTELMITRTSPTQPSALVGQRRELLVRWEKTLAQIRALPGLEHFGKPPPIRRLLDQAADGPIVVVNASHFRSDALIVRSDGICTVPLPDLTLSRVAEDVIRLHGVIDEISDPAATMKARRAAELAMFSIFSGLWDIVTGPVLDELGITHAHRRGEPWPRMWWSPAGLLGLLPLHAAGHHNEHGQPNPRTVLDRVVSSYIPTIQVLEHARSHHESAPAASSGVLLTALSHTPDAPRLPGVTRETLALKRRFPDIRVLQERNATRDHVLSALTQHAIAHFACHANTVLANPSHSHLLLHDGPLTIADISRQTLIGAQLAYLSACATTNTPPALADEAIHITAAFQLAGYPHVIGTLWPIDDDVAPDLADLFYTHLTEHIEMPRTDQTALALHQAIHQIRRRYPTIPSRWASHIHTGP